MITIEIPLNVSLVTNVFNAYNLCSDSYEEKMQVETKDNKSTDIETKCYTVKSFILQLKIISRYINRPDFQWFLTCMTKHT